MLKIVYYISLIFINANICFKLNLSTDNIVAYTLVICKYVLHLS